jgi:hypothetical protein
LFGNAYENLAIDPDKSGGLEEFGVTRTCPEKLTGTSQETGYVWFFWQVGFALHQLTRSIPLDSMELLGHK